MWSYVAIAALSGCMAFGAGVQWQLGVQARANVSAADARATDTRQQIKLGDKAAGVHAAALSIINNKLKDAREKIALLSGRECFGADTVGVLNDIGSEPVPATTSNPASAATTAATGAGIRFATERDAADAISICRAGYAELSSQLNRILDIEESRGKKE